MIPLLGLLPLALTLAPELAKLLGGPKAVEVSNRMVDVVQAVTGTPDPAKAAAVLADPSKDMEARIALAKIGADAAADERRSELETFRAGLADLASARSQTVALAQAGSKIAWVAPMLSLVVVAGYYLAPPLGAALGYHYSDTWDGVQNAGFTAVIGYWIGSSASGRRAQEANQAMAADATAHASEVVKAALPAAQAPPAPVVVPVPVPPITSALPKPLAYKRFAADGIGWVVTPDGIVIEGAGDFAARSPGEPVTVTRVWADYGPAIKHLAQAFQVPAELVVATICTESGGDTMAYRREPDGRESAGLTQALTGTASDLMGRPISVQDLQVPETAIEVCCRYLKRAGPQTGLDPILSAAAYNAGGLYYATTNRWRLRSTGNHLDRAAMWFGDACFVAQRDHWFA